MTAVAAIPQRRSVSEIPSSSDTTADLRLNRVVFFAGDLISSSEKYAEPMKGFGGVFLPQFKTLQHGGNKGMVYRCELTMLKAKMIGQPIAMLPPGEAATWDTSFIQPAAVQNSMGQWEDRLVTADAFSINRGDNYMAYKMLGLPGHDIVKMVQGTPPNGVRGVTEIRALKGAEDYEVDAAQLFFFENWEDIREGKAYLPETTRELEAHIHSRIAATNQLDPALRTKYRAIGEDMIRACTSYRQYANDIFKYNENLINNGKITGHAVSYPQVAEDMLTQFPEIKRKDDLASGASDSMTVLVEMQKLNAANEAKRLELQEREIALREAELGLRPMPIVKDAPAVTHEAPEVSEIHVEAVEEAETEVVEMVGGYVEAEPEVIAEVATEVRLCGKPKANGESCERVLKADEEACFQHK